MSTLTKHRESLIPRRSVSDVAKATGINRSTIYRIESGEVTPSRTHARVLFDHYKSRVPLIDIYDPEYAAIERRRIARKAAPGS